MSSFLNFDKSKDYIEESSHHLAGGVNSTFRSGMKPNALCFVSGDGAYLIDMDGNRLIDYYLGMGPMILGYNPSSIKQAIKKGVEDGFFFGAQSKYELIAAQMINKLVPSSELVRFCTSGSEAVQASLRLARAATKKNLIIKFEGHYHGWFDNVLWSNKPTLQHAGRRESPNLVAWTEGQDTHSGNSIIVLPWNDIEILNSRLSKGDIAAVIMEPAMCNSGGISPKNDYLKKAKQACELNDTLLIFDETITGFRFAPGGAQEFYETFPDITVFAKAIANGFPVAAITGNKELMSLLTNGKVVHGGTYNSHFLSMIATVKTLENYSRDNFHNELNEKTIFLKNGLEKVFFDENVTSILSSFPGFMFCGFGVNNQPLEYRDLLNLNSDMYILFCLEMIKRGVRTLERGAWFISIEHTEDILQETINIAKDAIKAIKEN
jgi:glutamate-1-semialdehyde 2,1-aminomutase